LRRYVGLDGFVPERSANVHVGVTIDGCERPNSGAPCEHARQNAPVLLTLTTTQQPATDLGYLLHKHPDRVQQFTQSFGTATVFYPEASDERCTAALLLEIDPVRLARSAGRGAADFSLAEYVNDRSYAASSLLGVALANVFNTARSGRCASRQALADSAIPLEITIPVLPCRGGPDTAHRIFGPLGWDVGAAPLALDDRFPEWGDSRYVALRLTGTVRLADALNQLHVLLPVMDESKHYWQSSDEVDKLLRSGEGWLAKHPERELITRRYLGRRSALTQVALARLAELDDTVEEAVEPPEEEEVAQPVERRAPLNAQRHDVVHTTLLELQARSVIDLGCGPGRFLERLVRDPSFTRIAGVDVSSWSLQLAARRLRAERLGDRQASRVELFQGALTYEDARLAGFDAAVLMEVIEHVDPPRLVALERVVFGAARPGAVLVTTPNSEYNVHYEGLTGMRHPDHRFEWTRDEFQVWGRRIAAEHGYTVRFQGIGDADPDAGSPTQMAVFHRD
jgi:3' terminal RNA ribose 2'-O-methyltransferase Hen1